jgi:two-component system chemotaxis sensor kinase CheA
MSDQPDFIAPFMEDYFAEAEEHLTAVRRGLLLIESAAGGDPPPAVVEDLFRSFHSLKGLSAMVELREAERLAHEMESCLGAIHDRQFVPGAVGFEALVDGAHLLEQVIAARRARSAIPQVDGHIARLTEACGTGASASDRASAVAPSSPILSSAAPGSLWKVTFTPSPDLVSRGIKVETIRARLADVGRIESVAPRVTTAGGISFDFEVTAADDRAFLAWRDDGITHEMVPSPARTIPLPPLDSPAARPIRAADAAPALTNFVRVDLGRLDDLMRLIGDLVVSRARLEDTLLRVEPFLPGDEWRTLRDEAESIERLVRDLREGVMRVRLVPVAEIFRRMPFVVRDLARDSGRRIQMAVSGQATEIDKFLIERMMDPILHLVRNAVSHGIEMPEERTAAGKRPDGTIRLDASTVGESVVLEVSDDGRGMNTEMIVGRARAAGLHVADSEVDARVLLDLICAPGFSTRMSVVRDTVQDLGGTLSVQSVAGRGTTFRAVLPLTLAITDALIVHVGDRTFAVPQGAVHEVAEVDRAALRAIENNELMTHRGVTLPVVRLARLFSLEDTPRQRMHVIVIGAGQAAVGILVDRISGQREIVVKTLRDPLVRVAGVSGATELGDGRLVLILDVAALTRSLGRRGGPVRAAN